MTSWVFVAQRRPERRYPAPALCPWPAPAGAVPMAGARRRLVS